MNIKLQTIRTAYLGYSKKRRTWNIGLGGKNWCYEAWGLKNKKHAIAHGEEYAFMMKHQIYKWERVK